MSTVDEDEEWEDSGECGQVGGAPWEVLGVRYSRHGSIAYVGEDTVGGRSHVQWMHC